jgi:RimJ/RimL family protein N-acetyltransferase
MGVPPPASLVSLHRSARLRYVTPDAALDSHKAFVQDLWSDPVATGMSQLALNKPANTDAGKGFFEFLVGATLAGFAVLDTPAAESEAAPGETIIGFVYLSSTSPIPGPWQDHTRHASASLGLAVLGPYRGRGFGPEMINWALDWGFRCGRLHRVEIGAFEYNPNAVRLYRRLGFREEGVERERLWWERRWWGVWRGSMLEGEWEALRGWKGVGGEEREKA